MKLIFLGTGGGRHMMASQVRATGGILAELDGVSFIIDPGPGALVNARSIKLDHTKWNGILVSHMHVDNSADVNVLIDGMKDSFLVAERHCILSKEKIKTKTNYYPSVSLYHQKLVKNLHPVKHGDTAKIGNLEVKAYKSTHYDPTVGFMITHPSIKIAYPADGPYYPGQEKHYEGCDVLILNVLVPKGENPKEIKHMSIDHAISFVRAMENKPKVIIIQHFSLWMLQHNLWKQAKILQDAVKIPVIIAEDFMEVDLEIFKTKLLKK